MEYGKLSNEIVEALRNVVNDESRIAVGPQVDPRYGQDEMPIYGIHVPDCAIDVLSTEEISAIMKICYEHDIPVTVRGSGTGLMGGAVPVVGGLVLSTHLMNQVIAWDDQQFAVKIQPGVLLGDLQEMALERGFLYAPDPANRMATIGGNVSTNAGGMRAIKYGTTREYVRSMTVVLPDGDIIHLGANTSKTSTGLNLTQLIASSFGTLGIITELTMKLLKAPIGAHSIQVPFTDLDTALSTVPKMLQAGIRPTAIEFFEKEVLYFAEDYVGEHLWMREVDSKPVGAYLLLLFDGDSIDEIRSHTSRFEEWIMQHDALDCKIIEDQDQQAKIWKARAIMLTAIFDQYEYFDENDACIPINHIAEFIAYTKETGQQFDFDVYSVGHAGDGNMHIFSATSDLTKDDFQKQTHAWMTLLYEKAKALGGELSGEHGIGNGKIEYYEKWVEPKVFELNKQIKMLFDPKLILNPGKIAFYPDKMSQYREISKKLYNV